MWVYADETGNTGTNLFDEAQPYFMVGFVACKGDFDQSYKVQFENLSKSIGVQSLHAKDFNSQQQDIVFPELAKIVRSSGVRFGFSRAYKPYMVVAKLFDTIFDPGENLGVPKHIYILRPLRLLLLNVLASTLTEQVVRDFWNSLFEPDSSRRTRLFLSAVTGIRDEIGLVEDPRAAQLIGDACAWALAHPESITLRLSKTSSLGHAPNVATFPPLMRLMDDESKRWNRSVKKLVHDRTSQFEKHLREAHDIFSNGPDIGPIGFDPEDSLRMGLIPGSLLEISASSDSPGLQLIDSVLWLEMKRVLGLHIPPSARKLMTYVSKREHTFELSFEAVNAGLAEQLQKIGEAPLTPELRERFETFQRKEQEMRNALQESYKRDKT